jgi:glycosyltransferase involved in cell wall biosynthesis
MSKRIAVFAPFSDFVDTYSLSSVVLDQCRGLRELGHQVELWVLSNCDPSRAKDLADCTRNCVNVGIFEPGVVTFKHLSYATDIQGECERFKPDCVITHDAFLQSAYIDFAAAFHVVTYPATFLHYIHSLPTVSSKDTDDVAKYRRTLPYGHFVVSPCASQRASMAVYFGVNRERILYCPNPHDLRSYGVRDTLADQIITDHKLLEADVVQILPACATRLSSKGLNHIQRVFEWLKRDGLNVKLVACDPNSDFDNYERFPSALNRNEMIFISQHYPKFAKSGLPMQTVSALFSASNLFFYPTMSEMGSLVLMEAAAAGCLLVLNSNVPSLKEHAPLAMFADFDAHQSKVAYQSKRVTHVDNVPSKTEIITGEEAYLSYTKDLAHDIYRTLRIGPLATRWSLIRKHSRVMAVRALVAAMEEAKAVRATYHLTGQTAPENSCDTDPAEVAATQA